MLFREGKLDIYKLQRDKRNLHP